MAISTTRHRTHTLWQITEGQRVRYGLSVVFSTIANVFMMGAPLIGMYALDVITLEDWDRAEQTLRVFSRWFAGEDSYSVYLLLSAIAGVIVASLAQGFQFIRDRLSAVASENISRNVRETLYQRIHHAPARFFDESETGDLVQRCSSDVETMRVFMHADVDEIGRAVLFLAVMTPILFYHNVVLTWISLALLPLLVVGAYFFFHRIRDLFQVADVSEGALTTVIQENLTGIRVVRAFARQEHEEQRFGERNRVFRNNNFRLNKAMAVYWGLADFIAMTQSGLVLLFGAYFISIGELTVGELFMFISLVAIVVWRIRHLGRILFDAGKATVALGRINHILNTADEPSGSLKPEVTVTGRIEFADVSLQYVDGKDALQAASFTVEAGEAIGIVGAPGSGKSTLVRALMRSYPLASGSILIDGIDIQEVDVKWLRNQIGIVLQDPFLYSKTIAENIRLGNADASQEALEAAAKEAAIHDAVERFKNGYESMVGERGIALSGGQRQRVAIARALLKDPPILILDDAVSAVDSGTEREILDALDRRRGRHTTIVIAHRLSTIRALDRVLVMEAGAIAQLGTHDELIAQPGFYRELCDLQDLMAEAIQFEVEVASHG